MSTIVEMLRRQAKERPNQTFLIFGNEEITYRQLDEITDQVAAGLIERGIKPGDHISIVIPNHPNFHFAWFGALKAGAAAVTVNTLLKDEERDWIIQNADSKLVLTGDLPRATPRKLPEVTPDMTAALVYTSGTTGKPKGAMLTHANYHWDTQAIVNHVRMTPEDRFVGFLPLFHVNAQVVTTLAPLFAGSSMVLMPKFSPVELLETLHRTRATAFSGVPTVYAILLNTPVNVDLSRLRFCICGAASMPVEVFTRFEEKFNTRILEGYGLTEATCASSVNPLEKRKVGSIGLPLPGQDMRLDPQTKEILIRGPNVMKGYYKNPEATAAAIRDGWLHTGDVGEQDEDGYFYIRGRLKDMINRGGEKVWPAEVEEILYRHPKVAEAAVRGVPDSVWGEEVAAYIVPKGEVTADELIAFCKQHLADFKCPRKVFFRDALPKTPTGKIQKHLL